MTAAKWDAGLYDAKHAFVWENAKGVVELLAPKPGERILDLGCGNGYLVNYLVSQGYNAFGTDASGEIGRAHV